MKNILEASFIVEMKRTTANMYRLGWHERNAGNISMILDSNEVEKYLSISSVKRLIPLSYNASKLSGKIFLVTGTGKYFKNIEIDPEKNLGIVRISDDGNNAELLWGFSDGGKFTSEFAVHLMCHAVRLEANPAHRVVMHCHPSNLVSMSYLHPLDERKFTRTLWQLCIEAILVFPEGLAVLPWMLCGTNDIAVATAEKMKEFKLVLWSMHGVFGSGNDLDEAFGLLETVEKAAEVYIKTSHKPLVNIVTDEQIKALADYWSVGYRKEFLDL